MISDNYGKYKFDFLFSLKNPPIRLLTTGHEIISSSEYHHDSRTREACYLFQYTLSGCGTITIGGEKKKVREGQAFFIRMPDNNEYFFEEGDGDWQFIYIKFDGTGCDMYYNLIAENFGNILCLDKNSKSILSLSETYRRASLGLIADSFTGERLTFDFLCKLCSDCMNSQSSYSDIVKRAKDIIDKDYSRIDGVCDVASAINISPGHLSRLFSSEMKTTTVEYLTKTRLQGAVNLLNSEAFTVEEIAKKCGFSSGNYFCKVFRKYMGISPLEYRRRNT